MTPKNKKTGNPGQKKKSPKSPNELVQKASPSEKESPSSNTKTLEPPEPRSITEKMNELSSEAPSSQQTMGGISLPVVPPTTNSGSNIADDEEHDEEDDEDDEESDFKYYEEDDDEDDDDEYNMASAEWKAKSQDRTRKFVLAFIDTTKSKHFIDMKIRPLVSKKDFTSWLFAMETNLRMHQVWEVVEGDLTMLASKDDLYPDLMRMKDVGCAVIYANISREVRECPCVYACLRERDPCMLMGKIHAHFGPDSEGTGGPYR